MVLSRRWLWEMRGNGDKSTECCDPLTREGMTKSVAKGKSYEPGTKEIQFCTFVWFFVWKWNEERKTSENLKGILKCSFQFFFFYCGLRSRCAEMRLERSRLDSQKGMKNPCVKLTLRRHLNEMNLQLRHLKVYIHKNIRAVPNIANLTCRWRNWFKMQALTK